MFNMSQQQKSEQGGGCWDVTCERVANPFVPVRGGKGKQKKSNMQLFFRVTLTPLFAR